MPDRHPLSPDPFLLEGGPAGMLLIHGFTGSPTEMRPIGDALADRGVTVAGPLLPGHGTVPEDLARVHWRDWIDAAEEALADLQRRCTSVFVGGLSMGSLLTLHLGAGHPELAGLVCYSPALKLNHPLLRLAPLATRLAPRWIGGREVALVDPEAAARVWNYGRAPLRGAAQLVPLIAHVRGRLADVRPDVLVIQSHRDPVVHPRSGPLIVAGVGSRDATLRWLHHSGHNIGVEGEWTTVASWTWTFVAERLP